ncbi:PREDICTED: early nodulin-like protein 3 [Tarenaya hassleriana]|uniref:early nodulin-like protein 3 n=1 Tax=Tarenaya hassleriana TaxID=28532 RepID=UPI00053C3EB1|nr:PREDICTED: early nodulin-like protein 3 [Tarenaya hassleriana]
MGSQCFQSRGPEMPSLMVLLVLFFGSLSEARDILVGGKPNSWKAPNSADQTLNRWAERTRFKVGDTLLWKYQAERDSVMQVEEEDYERCERSKPIRGYKDGKTKIELKRSGAYYFISGEKGRCKKGEKLVVVVLAPHHHRLVSPPTVSPLTSGSRLFRARLVISLLFLFVLV